MSKPVSRPTPEAPDDSVRGFLQDHEGKQLFDWAVIAGQFGPILEIGSYCGRSTLWLAQAAQVHNTVVYAVDHHRGSEEHQPGESHHDPALTNAMGQVDTFTEFRRNVSHAGLEKTVVPIVATSSQLAPQWQTSLGMVFIDGGHSLEAALTDYRAWAPHIRPGGILAIHDVFPDPGSGGSAPFTIWQLASQSGLFEPLSTTDSRRGLTRIAP